MKVYKTDSIQIQLFQVKPSFAILESESSDVQDYLLNSPFLEELNAVRDSVSTATNLWGLLTALGELSDGNERARRISGAFNKFLGSSTAGSLLDYDTKLGGVCVSEECIIKEGEHRDIRTAMFASFRFDRFDELGVPIFTVHVKNPLYFSRNLQAVDFAQFLIDRRNIYLPAFDRAKNFNNIIRSARSIQPYMYEEKTRKNPNPKRLGERFVAAGRMSQAEYDQLCKDESQIPVCYVTSYGDANRKYSYLARDLEIIASDALVGLSNKNPNIDFPSEIEEAVQLYRHAKERIHEQMAEKEELLLNLEESLSENFVFDKPIMAECHSLMTPRFRIKRPKDKALVEEGKAYYTDGIAGFGINALCYPSSESFAEKEEKFLRFFSDKSKIQSLGLKFVKVPYSAEMAVKEPVRTADRIVEASGGCQAALLVWPNWPRLPNNKLLEFELMRRGVAVQNVINENFQQDALKMSALMKGMAEKFPVEENVKMDEYDSIEPFDYALGLDVSRHGQKDVASFPVVMDRLGRATCTMGDTLYTQDKEKRSVSEIVKVIQSVLDANGESGERPVNLLFLRDGVAFEDYDAISKSLPDLVTLTVVSVRKNLMTACSEALPEGEFHSVFANHDRDRFVFGLNARQGGKAKLNRLHLAQVVRNPLRLENKVLGEILITLSCQNKTTEVELGSLPFPISYADRTAGDIRAMVDDIALCRHVLSTYPHEVDLAGGASNFIYREIKRFVEKRPNGYSFAI